MKRILTNLTSLKISFENYMNSMNVEKFVLSFAFYMFYLWISTYNLDIYISMQKQLTMNNDYRYVKCVFVSLYRSFPLYCFYYDYSDNHLLNS